MFETKKILDALIFKIEVQYSPSNNKIDPTINSCILLNFSSELLWGCSNTRPHHQLERAYNLYDPLGSK